MSFTTRRVIKMADTDATGGIYFARLQAYALEAFEAYLAEKGWSFETSPILLPIVHASCDYFAYLKHGEELTLELAPPKIGNTSLTCLTTITRNGEKVAEVKIVHVGISKETSEKVLPDKFLAEKDGKNV